jgi:hypothetical protein
MELGYSGEL